MRRGNSFLKNLFKENKFELIFLAVILLFSYHYVELRFFLTREFKHGTLAQIAYDSAYKPFQYRILIPYLANLLYQFKFPPFDSLQNISKLIEICSVFFLVLSFRLYISLFVKERIINSFLSFCIFFILPFNYLFPSIYDPYHPHEVISRYYCSDTPSVLLFTLGLVCMYQRKWIFYYLIFAIATFNRETTCFLIFIYLFTSIKKEKLSKIMYHGGAQIVIWITIKIILYKIFINNPGPNYFEWYDHPGVTHLSENLAFFKDFESYPLLFSNMGFIWIPIIFYYRLIKIEFVKRSLLVIFPFVIGMMLVANIYELRIYGELIPLVLMALFLILSELIKSKQETLMYLYSLMRNFW